MSPMWLVPFVASLAVGCSDVTIRNHSSPSDASGQDQAARWDPPSDLGTDDREADGSSASDAAIPPLRRDPSRATCCGPFDCNDCVLGANPDPCEAWCAAGDACNARGDGHCGDIFNGLQCPHSNSPTILASGGPAAYCASIGAAPCATAADCPQPDSVCVTHCNLGVLCTRSCQPARSVGEECIEDEQCATNCPSTRCACVNRRCAVQN